MERDLSNKALINQIPNVWLIQNVSDKDQVISDIKQANFFDLLRDQMELDQYNVMIMRITHMAAEVFPALNSNIHNKVLMTISHTGRGVGDDDDDDDDEADVDDECDNDDDDDTNNEYSVSSKAGNGARSKVHSKDDKIYKYIMSWS